MLIDTHAHLNDERLLPLVPEIVSRMEDRGLTSIVTVGYDYDSSKTGEVLARDYDNVYFTVGVHPHDAKTYTQDIEDYFANTLKNNAKCIALGEIGLDYYYDLSPREVQQEIFVRQLDLANALKMPVAIHLRDAYGDMMTLLKDNKSKLAHGIILHCYSGSKELVKELARYDAFFSFGGAITFKNAVDKPDVVRTVPRDRIMLETDCPYMTPVPYRGQTNLPEYVSLVRDKVAEILDIDREEVDDITTRNAKTLFSRLK